MLRSHGDVGVTVRCYVQGHSERFRSHGGVQNHSVKFRLVCRYQYLTEMFKVTWKGHSHNEKFRSE